MWLAISSCPSQEAEWKALYVTASLTSLAVWYLAAREDFLVSVCILDAECSFTTLCLNLMKADSMPFHTLRKVFL